MSAEASETKTKVETTETENKTPSPLINPKDLKFNGNTDFVSESTISQVQTIFESFGSYNSQPKLSKKEFSKFGIKPVLGEAPRSFLRLRKVYPAQGESLIAIYRDLSISKDKGKGYLGPKGKSADGWVKIGKVVAGAAKGSWVAVKYMLKTPLLSSTTNASLQEILALNKQNRLIGTATGGEDKVYIASPLISGIRLYEWKRSRQFIKEMKEDPKALLKKLLIVARHFMEELEYLHEHYKLNHGDVAMWNVMVDPNRESVTLIDFARSSEVYTCTGIERTTYVQTPSYKIGDNIDCLLSIIQLLDHPTLDDDSEEEWENWRNKGLTVTWLKSHPALQTKVQEICRMMMVAVAVSRSVQDRAHVYNILQLNHLYVQINLLNKVLVDVYGEKRAFKLSNNDKKEYKLSWDQVYEYLKIGHNEFNWDMRPYLKGNKFLLGEGTIEGLSIQDRDIDFHYQKIVTPKKSHLLFQYGTACQAKDKLQEKNTDTEQKLDSEKKTTQDALALADTFEGLKVKIESSHNFRKKTEQELATEEGNFVLPFIKLTSTDGALFYEVLRVDQPSEIDYSFGNFSTSIKYIAIIKISPSLGNKIEIYERGSSEGELIKNNSYKIYFEGGNFNVERVAQQTSQLSC